NVGCNADSICMRSMRLPLGRSLNVGGNSETRLNQYVPGDAVEMTKRLFVDGLMFAPVLSATEYCCHFAEIACTVAVACTVEPSLLSIVTVNGGVPACALA